MFENKKNSTAKITLVALFIALSAVLARLLSFAPTEDIRFSFESGIIYLSGILFGPFVGAFVGFASDFLGCVFLSSFGYNPIFCLPPILYGLCGGLASRYLRNKVTSFRLTISLLPPIVLGSVLWQSFLLDYLYHGGFLFHLLWRSVQFLIVLFVDVLVVNLLFKSKVFEKLNIWGNEELTKKSTGKYEKALEYIHSVCWKGSRPGLERTEELLRLMGNPEKKLKFIHIAGTNGKGSTASMSASILQEAGYTTGLYTSPYIFSFNERMRVNGENISERELIEVVEFVKPLAETMEDKPTEFELVTCIAFEFFKRRACDIVCLEVGMGGELDSTNVIESPVAAVITNVGLDHVDFLGDTVEKIAETKSKIIKEGTSAILYRNSESVEEVIEKRCREVGAKLVRADFDAARSVSADLDGQVFDYKDYKNIKLPLLGKHQLKNAATVLALVDELIEKGWNISRDNIYRGIEKTVWQGRFEVVAHKPLFIVDGGHNPQCIEALLENVREYLGNRKLIVLTGVLADKDYEKMYAEMSEYTEEFITVTPPNPRALDSKSLKAYLERFGKKATACETIEEGVRLAKERAGDKGVVLAYGSLYMVADIENYAKKSFR